MGEIAYLKFDVKVIRYQSEVEIQGWVLKFDIRVIFGIYGLQVGFEQHPIVVRKVTNIKFWYWDGTETVKFYIYII